MKPFRFQQFEIHQSSDVFRVGTDAVLIGVLSNVVNAKQILEVGTGTGIISLMLAQRNANANILALDINAEAVKISQNNFSNSPFSDKIKSQLQDFKNFETDEKFDLIISNPPYFKINNSEKDVLARQRLELDFSDLIQKASQLLSDEGLFSVICFRLTSIGHKIDYNSRQIILVYFHHYIIMTCMDEDIFITKNSENISDFPIQIDFFVVPFWELRKF